MKRIKQYKTLISLVIIIFIGCEETVDWKVDPHFTRLVVEGSITNELKKHKVVLTKSSDYFNQNAPIVVSNAELYISDGTTEFPMEELPSGSGIYYTLEEIQGVPGKTYTLNINLAELIDGKQFYSANSELHPTFDLDTVTCDLSEFDFISDSTVYDIKITGKEPSSLNNYYLINIFRNHTLITDTIDEVGYFDDQLINGMYLDEFTLYITDEITFEDTITVELSSITKGYFEFINALVNEIDGGDVLGVSGPPANIPGNISGGALGYFIASDIRRKSTIVTVKE